MFETALRSAKAIGNCDFRTTISLYTTGENDGPWIITIGESAWRRHLVVLRARGEDVELGILAESESYLSAIDMINTRHIDVVLLSDLVSSSYVGIKQLLKPAEKPAARPLSESALS